MAVVLAEVVVVLAKVVVVLDEVMVFWLRLFIAVIVDILVMFVLVGIFFGMVVLRW